MSGARARVLIAAAAAGALVTCADHDPTIGRLGDPLPAFDAGAEPPPIIPGFPCDVRVIVTHICQRCHGETPENEAYTPPFKLRTWEDTQVVPEDRMNKVYELMLEAIKIDFMPLTPKVFDPDIPKLTAAQKKTMIDWLEGGAEPIDIRADMCPDAGLPDAEPDAPPDARPDAPDDVSTDAPDAPSDAPGDTSSDAAADSANDAAADVTPG